MGISGSLTTDPLDFDELVQAFYGKYDDVFDFLIFISNLPDIRLNEVVNYYGNNRRVRNDVDGIGRSLGGARGYGSAERLKSIIHLSFYDGLERGPSLHEIIHTWANYAVPTTVESHWGFSSANGQVGGFDLANLVEHSPGKYSAGMFGTIANFGNSVPYSPIELYLAGLIPPSEVPTCGLRSMAPGRAKRTHRGIYIYRLGYRDLLHRPDRVGKRCSRPGLPYIAKTLQGGRDPAR